MLRSSNEGVDSVVSPDASFISHPRNPVFSVPFRSKGAQVIGREAALLAVREQLVTGRQTHIGHTAAFEGFGGLGKTQIAVEYCHLFKDSYPLGVIWINADQDIDAQLLDLAEKAQWVAPESANTLKLAVAQHRLRSTSDCLIVFDDLADIARIADYLPEPAATPHILVTSRLNHPGFAVVPIELLTEQQSLELLIQESGNTPTSESECVAAKTIAQKLAGLPLALELAGAYLRHRSVTWGEYLRLLNESLKDALSGKFLESFTQHERDIYSTLRINGEVFDDEPKLKEIIDLLTWSGSAPMSESLMCALLSVKPHELTGALGLAVRLRLLQKSTQGQSYSLHRLVQEVRRAEHSLAANRDWASSICARVGEWFQSTKRNFSDLAKFEAEVDHLQAWQANSLLAAPAHGVRLLWLQAYPAHHRGKNEEALAFIDQALELLETSGSNDPLLKAHLLNDRSTTLAGLLKFNSCLEPTEQALEIRLSLLGEKHSDTAMSLHNTGQCLEVRQPQPDLMKAKDYLERAFAVWTELHGEEHIDSMMAMTSLGALYDRLGIPAGLKLLETGLKLRQRICGERHPDTAAAYHELGKAYLRVGKTLGLDYVKKGLEIRRELLGEANVYTVGSIKAVVRALCARGLHGGADSALERYLQKLAKEHPLYPELLQMKRELFENVTRPGFRQKPKRRR